MVQSLLVYQASIGVSYWPFTSCCKGCVARAYLLRCMIDLLRCFGKRDHPIRLNTEFHLDLQWWFQFLSSWNGVDFWLFPGMAAAPDLVVTSDASGSLGFGAYFRGEWFSGSWTTSQFSQSIAYKELFPDVIAAHLWGPQWARRYVLFRSDNEAVVHILNSSTSKIPDLMCLLRHLLPSSMFPGFIILLLMCCPAFIGRSSGV